MKLNLGCGDKKLEGFMNIDKESLCNPDQIVDLEVFPWPFENNTVEEVNMEHILEHIGASTDAHRKIMQELYRICENGAKLRVVVPHPRSDSYLTDPTHVRPITHNTLNMYSKKECRQFIEKGWATTPLALYWDIDFEIKSVISQLFPDWINKFKNNELTQKEIEFAMNTYNNVINEIEVILQVIKGSDAI